MNSAMGFGIERGYPLGCGEKGSSRYGFRIWSQPSQRAYNWNLLESLGKCMQMFSKGRTVGPCIGHCQHGTVRTQGTVSSDDVLVEYFLKD